MTTVTLGRSNTTSSGFEQALEEIMEAEDPKLSLHDAVIHRYYEFCIDGTVWPESSEDVELLVPGSQRLIKFLSDFLRRDANGVVSGDLLCARFRSCAAINPYAVQPMVQKINEAWAMINDLMELDCRTTKMVAMAGSQVEEMKAKIDCGNWPECDSWYDGKVQGMRLHVQQKACDTMAAIQDSITEILRIWLVVDLEMILQQNVDSMDLLQQKDSGRTFRFPKGPRYCYGEYLPKS